MARSCAVTERPYRLSESRVPLDGIELTAKDLIEFFGGNVTSEGASSLAFTMPARKSVGTRDLLRCEVRWFPSENPEDEGTIEIASKVEAQSSPTRTAMLVIGVIGALVWLVWPFFPNLGAVSWVGAAVAFAAYFLSLTRSPAGTIYEFVQRLAAIQREARHIEEDDSIDESSPD